MPGGLGPTPVGAQPRLPVKRRARVAARLYILTSAVVYRYVSDTSLTYHQLPAYSRIHLILAARLEADTEQTPQRLHLLRNAP